MRRFFRAAVLAVGMMIATAAHTPTAVAGVDDCTYAAWEWCRGIEGPDGQYLTPSSPGWLACVAEAKQYLAQCFPRPSDGGTGSWCWTSWNGWFPC